MMPHPRVDDLPSEEDWLKSSHSRSSSAVPWFTAGENGEATRLRAERPPVREGSPAAWQEGAPVEAGGRGSRIELGLQGRMAR
jgi:hypothetical protein